ncbi:MAG: metallophosphoesterase [Candidatus Pacearchaeota archaeon]
MVANLSNFFIKNNFLIQPDLINFIQDINPNLILSLLIDMKAPKLISLNFFKKNKKELLKLLEKYNNLKKFEESDIFYFREKVLNIEEDIEITESIETNFEINKTLMPKKIEVNDFISYFRNRFNYFKEILKYRNELENLISIDKLPKKNQNVSVIGIVFSKEITKNNNIILTLEDNRANIKVLINKNSKAYKKALYVVEDEVIGVKGFGNKDLIFASDIIFPKAINQNDKKVNIDKNLVFISDIHIGSEKFLENNFRKFINWVNSNDEKAKKITHIFVNGDIVDGVGIYPGQEEELSIKDIKEQYKAAAEIFSEIRENVKLVFIPGNHDACRLVEPQIFTNYASPLQKLENAIFLPNPSYFLVYGYQILLYHGYSLDYYANNVYSLKEKKPYENPEILLEFLLEKRHLAPTHGSTLYFPCEEDFLIIKKIPDIFVTSHVHKTGIKKYENILLISTSCFQARTTFQEKFGHMPDPGRVPIFNTKTKKIAILEFN